MGPYAWEPKFQNATPSNHSQKFSNFPWILFPMVLTKIRKCDFWNFENWNFDIFFVFSLTWDPMGLKISKRYSYKSVESFQTCHEFSFQWSSQNYFWDFWNFEFLIFNDFFAKISNSPLYPVEKPKSSIIWKTSDRRAKRSEIWHSQVLTIPIWCTFDLVAFNVILGSFRWCICDFS